MELKILLRKRYYRSLVAQDLRMMNIENLEMVE